MSSPERELAQNPGKMTKKERGEFKWFLNKRSRDFHSKYYPGIKIFENDKIEPGRNYTWEAFVKYVAANPGNHAQNHHWKTLYSQCSPCVVLILCLGCSHDLELLLYKTYSAILSIIT